jgi:hypothetical protein
VTNEDSTGMFEDFLINGKTNNTLDDSISNNIISEDSLLNNILLRDDYVSDIPSGNMTVTNNSITNDFAPIVESNGAVSNMSNRVGATTNDLKMEPNPIFKKNVGVDTKTLTSQDGNLVAFFGNESRQRSH